MAVSRNRENSALSRRTSLRERITARLRWQISAALLFTIMLVNMVGFLFVGTAGATGESYNWQDQQTIQITPNGRIGQNPNGFFWNLTRSGTSVTGAYVGEVRDTSGCTLQISVAPSTDHATGVASFSPAGASPCNASVFSNYDTNINIGQSIIWNNGGGGASGSAPIGCPGGPQGPIPANANYPCPGGGAVVNGTYFVDGNTGRIQGKATWSDGGKTGNCAGSTINVTRINGVYSGDTSTTTGVEGTFVLMLGSGQVTLATPDCHAVDTGNIYSGTSKTITVPANGMVDGSFVADQLVATGGSTETCDSANFTELNFWVCALIDLLALPLKGLDAAILAAVKIDTNTIFNDNGSSAAGNAYYLVWVAFRNLAYAVLVGLAFVMVISQIFGLDFVSAYEFRKWLPQFLIITFVLAVLWNAQDLVYNAANDAADAVQAMIAAPFANINVADGNTVTNVLTLGVLLPALVTIGAPAGVAALALLGVGGIAALILSLFLAVASAWILIEFRDVMAGLLIMISALAVVCSIFGPFKKLYSFWLGTSIAILISIPGLAAIIKIGQEAAKIAYVNNHAVVAAIILGVIYLFFWRFLLLFDKATGQLGNALGGITSKARAGLAKYRSNTMKRRLGEAVEGKRDIRGARMATNLARRFQNADQGGLQALLPGRLGRQARVRYAGAETAHLDHTVAEMMKRDGGRSGGDDDAMDLAQRRGMDDETFVREYSQRLQDRGIAAGQAQRQAETALGTLRSSFGAELGTDAMRVAAYRSLLNSKTSYADPTGANGQDNWEQMIGDGNDLMADGLMTSTDVTMAIKSRGDRVDRAGVGFGTLQGQVERSFERYQQGARRALSVDNDATEAARTTLTTAGVNVNDMQAVEALADDARVYAPAARTAEQQAAITLADSQLVTASEAKAMRKEALFGTQAGGVVGGRHEAVSALGGTMIENVQETHANLENARAAATAAGVNAANRNALVASARAVGVGPLTAQQQAALNEHQAQEQFERELAAIAGRYDAMGQASPQNATIMANNVLSQTIPGGPVHPATIEEPVLDPTGHPQIDPLTNRPITRTVPHPDQSRAGTPMTVQELIEAHRNARGFDEMRREYMNQGLAAAAAAGGGVPGGAPVGGGGGGGGGGIVGP